MDTMGKGIAEKRVAVYNDNTGIAETMMPLLAGEGISLTVARGFEQLEDCLGQSGARLLLIDVELDGKGWGSGIETITNLRRQYNIPIIVVSAEGSETAKIMALNAGADDYVTADCNPLELLARVKCHLRRYGQLSHMRTNIDRIYRVDGLVMNDMRRTVTVDGREVRLTPIEYKILRLLMQEKGRVMSISQIYESIWHMQAYGADNCVAVHVRHIREKIESNPRQPHYLKVVWGNGYKVG